MSVRPRIRFEVFKRDKFTCRYCGAMPPDVELQIDHVNPVSNWGSDDISNLVTSCRTCNIGKSSILLSKITDAESNFTVIKSVKTIPFSLEEKDLSGPEKQLYAVKNIVYTKYGFVTKYFTNIILDLINKVYNSPKYQPPPYELISKDIYDICNMYPFYNYFILHVEMWADKFYCRYLNEGAKSRYFDSEINENNNEEIY